MIGYALALAVASVVVGVLAICIALIGTNRSRETPSNLWKLQGTVARSAPAKLAIEVADLAAALDELQRRNRKEFGKLWAKHMPEKQALLMPDEPPETDDDRRARLRRELLPKSMAGKVQAMRDGLAQPE